MLEQKTQALNKVQTNCLTNRLNNTSYEDTVDLFGQEATNLVNCLLTNGYGYLYNNQIYSDDFKKVAPWDLRGLFEKPPTVEHLYLEVTRKCNFNCIECSGSDKRLISYPCKTCLRWKYNNLEEENISIDTFKKILSGFLKLDLKSIVLCGGNPILEFNLLKEYISFIRVNKPYLKLEVILNGSLLNKEMLDFFYDKNVNITFVVFGNDEMMHQKITGVKNAFVDVNDAINRTNKNGNKLGIAALSNFDGFDAIEKQFNITSISEVLSKMNGKKNTLTIQDYKSRKKGKFNVLPNEQVLHPCLSKTLAISRNGQLLPCPHIDDKIHSYKKSDDFAEPFQSFAVDKYFRLSKSLLNICKNCSTRFLYSDCGVVELLAEKNELDTDLMCEHISEVKDYASSKTYI